MQIYLKILSWIWQLPQNLFGFLLTRRIYYKSIRLARNGKWYDVYFKDCGFNICLGDFIILDSEYIGKAKAKILFNHEYGHSRQSLILGWLYLPLVGLPSIMSNVWDRLFHKNWTREQREKWYYGRYPENWADKLGGVIRD